MARSAMKTLVKKRSGAGCLVLFALPFALVGVGAIGWGVWTLVLWQRMSAWVEVPAHIVALDLETHHDEDSTSYSVEATYEYRYDERTFTGERVAIYSGTDNVGGFQHDLYSSLRRAKERGTAVAYVNPSAPEQATLNRELRLGMLGFQAIFAIVFGGIGFGLLFGARYGSRKLEAEAKLRERYPDRPWAWREEWQTPTLRSSTRAATYVAIGFAVIWNAISSPILFLLPEELAHGNVLALIGLLFPIVGVGLAFWAGRSWLRTRRFKQATFTLDRLPVPLGGRLRGSVVVGAEVPITSHFRFDVACAEQRRRGRNDDSSERLVWQFDGHIPRVACQIGGGTTRIPIDVPIPRDAPPTRGADEGTEIQWRLEVTGECEGPDFWAQFELPVFDVGELQPAAASAAEPSAEGSCAERPLAAALAALGIRAEALPGGREAFTFRRAQHRGIALGLTAFTLMWSAVAVGLLFTSAPIVIPIGFLAFDPLLVWWALSLWFTEYRIEVDDAVITLKRTGFMARAPLEIPRAWVKRVRARRGMQAGQKLYYDLTVETNDGQHTAASSIGDYSVASWLARHLMGDAPKPA
jgi:hypothetical protein